jgi:5-methylcytosine-specific restriction enzyme subunit McrC
VAAALAASGVVKVIPVRPPQLWRIEADSRVGVLVGDGWELRIRPHIEISKLIFLLTYSLAPSGWEGALSGMTGEQDMVQALVHSFCLHAEGVLRRGLLDGYVSVEDRRCDVRGRVRFGDQLGRLAGLPLPVEVSYDEFTADIPENRLLRSAVEKLLLADRLPPLARARLLRLRGALGQVSVLADQRRIDLPRMTRLNRRYEAALLIAKMILDGTSLGLERGPIVARSFLFDMSEVFESFLFTALRESLRSFGGVLRRQVPECLDGAEKPDLVLRADIVWYERGVVRAVIDAKYKALNGTGSPPNDDAYQMLAYCIGYGVRRGLLVYACDRRSDPRRYQVKRHGYEIEVRSLGLEQEPARLLEEVGQLAMAIASNPPLDACPRRRRSDRREVLSTSA